MSDLMALAETIGQLLCARGQRLATAESCTGGLVGHLITNIPGSSDYFWGSAVTYSNEAKMRVLGVRAETLTAHGAVSAETAQEMAQGARRLFSVEVAASVTGIAGPGGGSEAKPVGTVFIGLAGPTGTPVLRQFNPYDRETFKQATANQALEMLRRLLLG